MINGLRQLMTSVVDDSVIDVCVQGRIKRPATAIRHMND